MCIFHTPKNSALQRAKKQKNDEFYTQYKDIEKEVMCYTQYDPDVFRGKTILLPCDDPEWSNFTKFFIDNFENFGIKKLISSCYQKDDHGKVLFYTQEKHGPWIYLNGDGDFRSDEVRALRDEADIIITNPPFSLFREFFKWIMEAEKKFLIIGNINAITYKEVFPLIKDNKMWLGNGFKGMAAHFINKYYTDYATASDHQEGMIRVSGVVWFTNIDHGRRRQPLSLMSYSDNLRFSRHKEIKGVGYAHYDNYDAIEVPFTDAIPGDYEGVMGVPITFLDKYCPEQFEIIGIMTRAKGPRLTNGNDNRLKFYVQNKGVYARIIIRKKPSTKSSVTEM